MHSAPRHQPDWPALIYDADLSYGDAEAGNLLLQGDNLSALGALEPDYADSVQVVYIDPPYNTGQAFEHYSDDLAHSAWLSMMRPRLGGIRRLMRPSGIFFCSIGDAEMAYLKVLCDEVFGRANYIGTLIWEKKKKPSFLSHLGAITEYILVYAKERRKAPPLYYGTTTKNKKYPLNNAGNGLRKLRFPAGAVAFGIPDQVVAPQDMSGGNIITRLLDSVEIRDGRNHNAFTLEGEWRYSQSKLDAIVGTGEALHISKVPFRPNHIRAGGRPKKMKNLLSIAHYDLPTYEDATEESRRLFGPGAFDYPKPEGLIHMLIHAASQPGDLVLDAFLGSGTTAAVALKSQRRWIGIEAGSHCRTHCLPRLKGVVDGNDQVGVTHKLNWTGGGGFSFYHCG